MDGVCCDWAGAVFTLFGRENKWPIGHNDIKSILNVTSEKMWEKIDLYDDKIWTNLQEYPWFKEMYNRLLTKYDVYFLTSPSQSKYSASGKIQWLQNRFGKQFNKYIITTHKHLLANKNSILIDDTLEKIQLFREHGGKGLLFPQPWNGSPTPDNMVEYITKSIDSYFLTTI